MKVCEVTWVIGRWQESRTFVLDDDEDHSVENISSIGYRVMAAVLWSLGQTVPPVLDLNYQVVEATPPHWRELVEGGPPKSTRILHETPGFAKLAW